MNQKYNHLLVLLIISGLALTISAQQAERYLEIRGHAEKDAKPLNNATAILYDGNTKVNSLQTGQDGSFVFKLEANKLYTVEVTKNALVTKKISFNTALPDDETGLWVREFAIVLVNHCEGVDYSALQKPVDIIKFNSKRRDFESDKDYVEQMMPKLQDIFIKSEKCLTDKYDLLVSQADKQFEQKNYEEARSTYQQALDIMPNEMSPKKRISEIDALKGKQKNDDELYEKTISEADALMVQQQYNEALAKYQSASVLKPQETYAAVKINEIQTLVARQKNEKQSAATAEAKYNDLTAKAGQAYAQKNYEMSKKYYQDALLIKPGESSPMDKIRDIDALIEQQTQAQAKQKSVDEAYLAAVTKADALFKSNDYEAAKAEYAKALSIKPSESYPRTKSTEIDRLGEQQAKADQTARIAELNRNFEAALAEGDNQFKAKNYEAAIAAYTNALTFKPNDDYAKQRIAAIDKIAVNDQAARQKSIEDGYKNAMAAANAALAQKQYPKAREQYQQALTFKPEDVTAKIKIAEADRLIEEQNKTLAAEELRNNQYQEALATADKSLQAKDYAGALAGYQKALSIKPGDAYAQQRITGIENALAADQAARQKSIEEGYKNAMTTANAALAKKEYPQAREQYQKALTFKPEDVTAKIKITEVDRLIEEQNKTLAAEELRNKQYQEAIAAADKTYQAKDYTGALAGYRQALGIKPGDAYAQQRITGIENALAADQAARQKSIEDGYKNAMTTANAALAQKQYPQAREQYQKALTFKPEDVTAKIKITEVDRLIEEQNKTLAAEELRNKQYQEAIATADKTYQAKDYTGALAGYRQALGIKPGDAYAQQRITGIENALAADQAARQKSIEDGYKNAMATANAALAQKQYPQAREQYQKALTFKPEDVAAKTNISEVDRLIEEQNKALAAEELRSRQYKEAIARADNLFSGKDYDNSKLSYEAALKVIPGEIYPKERIVEIDKIIAEQQQAAAETQARDNAYNAAIKNADQFLVMKNYNEATSEYSKALSLKPNEMYPKNKLSEIEKIVAAGQKALADAMAKDDAYNAAIASGNAAYSAKKYTEAKGFYNQALKIKPDDAFSRDQIILIDNLLADLEKQKQADQAKQKQYTDLIASADKAFDAANYTVAKDIYQKALAVQPENAYPKLRIARIDEINRLLAQNARQQATKSSVTQKLASTTPLALLNFKNDSERDIYLNELKRKYPEGVTLETYKEKYKETRRYIIVRDEAATEFRDVLIKTYGGHEYSMNGKTVTQMYFEQQVKGRPGEYYNEIIFE